MEKEKEQGPTVDTGGGAYVGGDVDTGGGPFVGRDRVVQAGPGGVAIGGDAIDSAIHGGDALGLQQGATLDQFVRLLAEMRRLVPQAGLEADEAEVIEGDFRVVEEQVQKPQPSGAIILSKLKGVTELLTTAVAASEAAQKLLPMAQQAVEWAGKLFR
jgi:transposase